MGKASKASAHRVGGDSKSIKRTSIEIPTDHGTLVLDRTHTRDLIYYNVGLMQDIGIPLRLGHTATKILPFKACNTAISEGLADLNLESGSRVGQIENFYPLTETGKESPFKGNGFGKAVLAQLESDLRAAGVSAIALYATEESAGFYENNHYTRTSDDVSIVCVKSLQL